MTVEEWTQLLSPLQSEMHLRIAPSEVASRVDKCSRLREAFLMRNCGCATLVIALSEVGISGTSSAGGRSFPKIACCWPDERGRHAGVSLSIKEPGSTSDAPPLEDRSLGGKRHSPRSQPVSTHSRIWLRQSWRTARQIYLLLAFLGIGHTRNIDYSAPLLNW